MQKLSTTTGDWRQRVERAERAETARSIQLRISPKDRKAGLQSMIWADALFISWKKEGATVPALVLGQAVK